VIKNGVSTSRHFRAVEPRRLLVSGPLGLDRNRRDWGFDTELTVLDARANDGSHIATLVNFAAHRDLSELNKLISRDFCGYTVDFLE
jgi:hypothetical protein